MVQRRDHAQNQPQHRAQCNGHAAHLNADGKPGLDELADGGVFADVVAHAEITLHQIGHIPPELNQHRLIQTIFFVQDDALVIGEFLVVEGGTGHELQQAEQHQCNGQQGEYRDEHSFQNITFHKRSPSFDTVF